MNIIATLRRLKKKVDALSNGISRTSLSTDVQTSLAKADTAYQKSSNGIPKTDLSQDLKYNIGQEKIDITLNLGDSPLTINNDNLSTYCNNSQEILEKLKFVVDNNCDSAIIYLSTSLISPVAIRCFKEPDGNYRGRIRTMGLVPTYIIVTFYSFNENPKIFINFHNETYDFSYDFFFSLYNYQQTQNFSYISSIEEFNDAVCKKYSSSNKRGLLIPSDDIHCPEQLVLLVNYQPYIIPLFKDSSTLGGVPYTMFYNNMTAITTSNTVHCFAMAIYPDGSVKVGRIG